MPKTFCHCGGEIINGHHCANGHLMLRNDLVREAIEAGNQMFPHLNGDAWDKASHTAIPITEERELPKLTRSQWMMLDSAFFMLGTNYKGEHVMQDAIAALRETVFAQFSKEVSK